MKKKAVVQATAFYILLDEGTGGDTVNKRSRAEIELVNAIKAEMAKSGINMKALAKMTGVSLSTLYEVMGGRVSPRLATVAEVCDKLNMKLTVTVQSKQSNKKEKKE